jgi:excisionase family DNA binding protein
MEKDVLNFSDLVTYTGLSKSYLYKLTSQGILPHSKPFGKMLFFDKKEIDTFLMSNHNTPPDLTASKAAAFVHLKNAGAR